LNLLQWIYFTGAKKKTTGAVSPEQILLLEKIFDFAPVNFFHQKKKKKKNHRSSFTGADTVARENI